MNICMAGIDFNKASIAYREKFALTKLAQNEMLAGICTRYPVSGCVIINTCNRMELWISCGEGREDESPYEILCGMFCVDPGLYREYFTERNGTDAVGHLYELACGLKSKIFGEEQILAQVKDSICIARECGAADPALEALFRSAVTAAKKVKTQVQLVAVNRSAASSAVALIKERTGEIKGLTCLVIGNGEMGRLAAKALIKEGCQVFITLRQYKSGDAVIPSGCKVIDYEARYDYVPKARIVISATRSPHYTLHYEKMREIAGDSEKILFDLALPRDIEPEIAKLPNITLYDIDHLDGALADVSDGEAMTRVRAIIDGEISELKRWDSARNMIPKISEAGALAKADVEGRIRHGLKKTPLDAEIQKIIFDAAGGAVDKVVESMMFNLRKNMGGDIWDAWFSGVDGPADAGDAVSALRFPLFVDLSGKKIAVVGAGVIASRRISALLPFPCRIRVTALEAREEIVRMSDENKISLKIKAYDEKDIEGSFLVIAATDDRELNHRISLDAKRNGQYCSVADCREECTFYFPATVPYTGGVIGICGNGEDHARTKEISANIKKLISEREETWDV